MPSTGMGSSSAALVTGTPVSRIIANMGIIVMATFSRAKSTRLMG